MKEKKKVYLTFGTDQRTSSLLTTLAHTIGITQPELINHICQNYIEAILEEARKIDKEKNNTQ